jgi:hypothetical protein
LVEVLKTAVDLYKQAILKDTTRFLVDTSKDFFEQLCAMSLSVIFTEVNSDGTSGLGVQ